MFDRCHPLLRGLSCFPRAVVETAHCQGIRKARDAKADAALCKRLSTLLRKWITGDVDDVVHESNSCRRRLAKCCVIDAGVRVEWIYDKSCQVQRAEQAGAIGRKWLFTTRVCRSDGLAIREIVQRIYAVDEDDARLGELIGRPHDPIPQLRCGNGTKAQALKHKGPFSLRLDCCHEGICHEDGKVEIAQTASAFLGSDEVLNVWMVAPHGPHHRAAPGAGGHDGLAHGIPHIHETDWT